APRRRQRHAARECTGRRGAADRHRHRLLEGSGAGSQRSPGPRHDPHARLDAPCRDSLRRHRHDSSPKREDRPMSTPLALNTSRVQDGTLVLSAAGELDLSNVDTFAQAVTDALSAADSAELVVTVDLRDIEYLDSSAINVLFTHARQIRGLIINPLL